MNGRAYHYNEYGAIECDQADCPCHYAYGYHEVTLHAVADLATDMYCVDGGANAPLPQKRPKRGKWRQNKPLSKQLYRSRQYWSHSIIPESGHKISTKDNPHRDRG